MAKYNKEHDCVEHVECRWCEKEFDRESDLIKHIESEECPEI